MLVQRLPIVSEEVPAASAPNKRAKGHGADHESLLGRTKMEVRNDEQHRACNYAGVEAKQKAAQRRNCGYHRDVQNRTGTSLALIGALWFRGRGWQVAHLGWGSCGIELTARL